MKALKNSVLQALVWFIVGACVMAGMKLADWMIPNPPREPIQLQLKDSATVIEPPVLKQKRPYVIG